MYIRHQSIEASFNWTRTMFAPTVAVIIVYEFLTQFFTAQANKIHKHNWIRLVTSYCFISLSEVYQHAQQINDIDLSPVRPTPHTSNRIVKTPWMRVGRLVDPCRIGRFIKSLIFKFFILHFSGPLIPSKRLFRLCYFSCCLRLVCILTINKISNDIA